MVASILEIRGQQANRTTAIGTAACCYDLLRSPVGHGGFTGGSRAITPDSNSLTQQRDRLSRRRKVGHGWFNAAAT